MENKKSNPTKKKKLWLIILAVILGLWILITLVDFARFVTADKPIDPIITMESGGCHCCEERWSDGIGYTMSYSYDSFENLYDGSPCRAEFRLFGYTVYSKD